MYTVESPPTFRRNVLSLSSGSKNKPEQETRVKASGNMLVSFSAYSSTLKMKEKYSSETSVGFQRYTWRYIPEDSTLLVLKGYAYVSSYKLLLSSRETDDSLLAYSHSVREIGIWCVSTDIRIIM
jgi:hypothetical protein